MSRSWNILNWNVRGINSNARWNDIRQKMMKVHGASLLFRKQREKTLILPILRISALGGLISTAIHPQLVALVA